MAKNHIRFSQKDTSDKIHILADMILQEANMVFFQKGQTENLSPYIPKALPFTQHLRQKINSMLYRCSFSNLENISHITCRIFKTAKISDNQIRFKKFIPQLRNQPIKAITIYIIISIQKQYIFPFGNIKCTISVV